jgi:phage protein D
MACKKPSRQPDLRCEIGVLAEQISDAIKSAAHSREVSDIRSDIKDSVRSVSDRVVKAVKKASDSQALDDIKGQTKKIASLSKQQGLKAAKNLRLNLSAGLDAAGQELQRLAEKLKKQS